MSDEFIGYAKQIKDFINQLKQANITSPWIIYVGKNYRRRKRSFKFTKDRHRSRRVKIIYV